MQSLTHTHIHTTIHHAVTRRRFYKPQKIIGHNILQYIGNTVTKKKKLIGRTLCEILIIIFLIFLKSRYFGVNLYARQYERINLEYSSPRKKKM